MRSLAFILLLIFCPVSNWGQSGDIDSLRREVEKSRNDTLLLTQFTVLASRYIQNIPDSCYFFAEKGLQLSRELGLRLDEAVSLLQMGYAQMNMGNYARCLQYYLNAFRIAEDGSSEKNILPARYLVLETGFYEPAMSPHQIRIQVLSWLNEYMGILYENTHNYEKALWYVHRSKQLAAEVRNVIILNEAIYILGRLYLAENKLDSALIYEERAMEMARSRGIKNPNTLNLGRIYKAMGERHLATGNFRTALAYGMERKYFRGIVASNLELSAICLDEGKMDSGYYFANTALGEAERMHMPDLLLRSYKALAEVYRSTGRDDSAVKYQALIIKINDSIFNAKQAKLFQNIEFVERQRQQEMEADQKAYRNRVLTYGLLSGLAVLFMVAVVLFRNNRHKQKAYAQLARQKHETDIQKAKVEQTLEELKAAQLQLIHSAKMASLGQLTAGIAHEIKNPLNFVNNFSEVNKELIGEMRQELEAGNAQAAVVISREAEDNLDKIICHGRRADAIVNSMLLHSAKNTGKKEPTDINALVEECMRLAYHTFRTKESIDARQEIELDGSIHRIDVVPQDIGRVLLNVYDNAFYAVSERSKRKEPGYEPMVSASVNNEGDKVMIRIKDNGIGIADALRERIFDPFFTTKPAGQGAGLGLSLSYETLLAHGGTITVDSREGEWTEFVIQL
jgi:two-component system NtrC family sensor kinase